MTTTRPFRPKQRGVRCSVTERNGKPCRGWCVSNDMCARHNIAKARYGNPLGKRATKRVCKGCGEVFEHKYEVTAYCLNRCWRNNPEQKARRNK